MNDVYEREIHEGYDEERGGGIMNVKCEILSLTSTRT